MSIVSWANQLNFSGITVFIFWFLQPEDWSASASVLASFPGHSWVLSRSRFLRGCKIKSTSGLGTRLQVYCHFLVLKNWSQDPDHTTVFWSYLVVPLPQTSKIMSIVTFPLRYPVRHMISILHSPCCATLIDLSITTPHQDAHKGQCCRFSYRSTRHASCTAKQVGCFNHRVVTMVADKLQRQWFALVLETNCIRQPKGQLPSSPYNHNTLTTTRTSVKESLQMHSKLQLGGSQMFECLGFSVYCGCKIN